VSVMEQLRKVLAAPAALGLLRRDWIVTVCNISAAGCLIESDRAIDSGVVGTLRIVMDGVEYSDLVRVARCRPLAGRTTRHQIGVEFVWNQAPGELALRRLVEQLGSFQEMVRRARFSAASTASSS
jgi:PilZ domain